MARLNQKPLRSTKVFPESVQDDCKELLQSDALKQSPLDEDLCAYAIDDADTSDVDDALAIEVHEDYLVLHVLIADAAGLIPLNSQIGEEARKRGGTLYLPDGRIPMLPESLSEGVLSLGPGQDNQVLDFRIALTSDFRPYDIRIRMVRVPNIKRLSYAQVDGFLKDPESCDQPEQARDIAVLNELASHYQQERIRQGAMIWQPNDYKMTVDSEEQITITPVPVHSPARTLVAECMIMAGAMTARFCAENQIPTVFRVQSNTVRQNKRKKLTYRPSLAEIYEQFRGMKPASLKLQPGPHAGLGVPQYVQITSPIRRYQDLVLHNQLRGYVQRGSPPLRAQALLELFSELEDLNRSNNRAMRNARSYWSLRHYAHQLGNEVEGEVTEVNGRVAKVFLLDSGYIANWIPGRSVAPGEIVRLKITAVDAENDQLILFPA